jgi:hypothetical protein
VCRGVLEEAVALLGRAVAPLHAVQDLTAIREVRGGLRGMTVGAPALLWADE